MCGGNYDDAAWIRDNCLPDTICTGPRERVHDVLRSSRSFTGREGGEGEGFEP